eukprot:3570185-Pleurochrysis_carterae.AAC.2
MQFSSYFDMCNKQEMPVHARHARRGVVVWARPVRASGTARRPNELTFAPIYKLHAGINFSASQSALYSCSLEPT